MNRQFQDKRETELCFNTDTSLKQKKNTKKRNKTLAKRTAIHREERN